HSTNALDVGVPTALGAAVRVRNAVPERRAFAADVAVGSHDNTPWDLWCTLSVRRCHAHTRATAQEYLMECHMGKLGPGVQWNLRARSWHHKGLAVYGHYVTG